MKRIALIVSTALIFIIAGCSDLEQFETTPQINLGTVAKSTDIKSIEAIGGKVTVKYTVTPSAKYSVQVFEFAQMEPKKTLPFTAVDSVETKVYEFSDLNDGLYDLVLTDISGTSIKKPLVIKK
ncbi:hypothetical protein [Flavobacterium sp.]|uniref:hypothetical protein n=1 Tax=Flavobacterium sp. TaxID=239 RepID=UPI0025D8271D|nr:hypothetical protein [Flavobacterium sp.]